MTFRAAVRKIMPWAQRRVVRRYSHPTHTTTLELRQPLPVLAWAALALWHVAAPTEVSAVLLAGLTGVLVLAWVWARAMALGFSARRELRYAAVQVGDVLEEQVSLENRSRLPALWAELADQSNVPGYSLTSVRAVDGQSTNHWRTEAVCTLRGLYTLGPWEVRLGDPFGFWRVRQVYSQSLPLLVYPPLAPLPPRLDPLNSQMGEHRRLRQALRADTLSALSTRPYLPGDPLRHVHWPTTARQGSLYTRVFDPEATSRLWLVTDFDPGVHVGAGPDSTEELMVVLAASLAEHLLRRNLAVGLLAHTGEVTAVHPQSGRPHLWQLLRALAGLHATCPFALAQALARLQVPLTPRDRLVVITPTLDPGWPRALRSVAFRGGVDCLLLDPETFGAEGGKTNEEEREEHEPARAAGTQAPRAAEVCALALAEQGVAARVVRRGEIRPAEATYGTLRRWEFTVTATGRAVATQTPRAWAASQLGGQPLAAAAGGNGTAGPVVGPSSLAQASGQPGEAAHE